MHQCFVMLTSRYLNNPKMIIVIKHLNSLFQFLIIENVEQRNWEELLNYFEIVKQLDFPITQRACESHKRK